MDERSMRIRLALQGSRRHLTSLYRDVSPEIMQEVLAALACLERIESAEVMLSAPRSYARKRAPTGSRLF